MSDATSIPIPTALKELIISNNELLTQYQQKLTNKVLIANEEMMKLLSLDPNDGWRLDIGTYSYVKVDPSTQNVTSVS